MFKDRYRQEMDQVAWSDEQRQRLRRAMEKPGRRPRLTRRAAAVAAVCAALALTALAAGPGAWEALAQRLGPYGAYLAAGEGASADQGVEVALVGSLSDGYTARVYFTATDRTGQRFNEHTRVSAWLSGRQEEWSGGFGCQVLSYDAQQGQLLVEASLEGVDSGSAVQLEVSRFDPGYRYIQDAKFQPPACAQVLETEPGEGGGAVLKAGQTPQASPDTADFSISSMGFDSQGGFHIRLAMAEGFRSSALLALPYDAAGEQMGSTLEQTEVPGGVDCLIGGITPAEVAEMDHIRVYGAYRGPEEAVEGTWILPVTLEPAEQRTLALGRAAGPYWLEEVELSPLSVALRWRRLDGQQGHPGLQVTLRDGSKAGLEEKGGSTAQGWSCDFWFFTQPVELEDIASITVQGETIPLPQDP